MAQVFISHAAEDAIAAKQIANSLRRAGIGIWMAPESIPPGMGFNEAIMAGLRSSDALAVLISNASNISRHVEREVHLADDLRLKMFPVRLALVPLADGLKYYLSLPQWIEWHSEGEAALKPLVQMFGAASAAQKSPLKVAPTPPPVPSGSAKAITDTRLVLEILRLSAFVHNAELMEVSIDGKKVLDLRDAGKAEVRVLPGRHTVSARLANLANEPFQFELLAGEGALQVLPAADGLVWMKTR